MNLTVVRNFYYKKMASESTNAIFRYAANLTLPIVAFQ